MNNTATNIPSNMRECFKQLNSILSEEDKNDLITHGADAAHFGLGLWIRNNWLYPPQSKLSDYMQSLNTDQWGLMICHPDNMSDIIIIRYIRHLKRKRKK